ncbi:MAG: response regulator transcription factor [Pseudonocardia sp.]|nr:response regulator transcription factor [Pseudonocardia sp.]
MGTRLLVVDDHAAFRSVACRLLAAGGFTVVGEAGDGAGAIEAALRLQPDVVVLDVQLPDVDGFAVAEELARHPAPPAVVLVSSRSLRDYGRRVAESPVCGFVPKSELSGEAIRLLLPPEGAGCAACG